MLLHWLERVLERSLISTNYHGKLVITFSSAFTFINIFGEVLLEISMRKKMYATHICTLYKALYPAAIMLDMNINT